MNALTGFAPQRQPDGQEAARELMVEETAWGYGIRDARPTGRGALIEGILRLVGLVLVLTAFALWLVPGPDFGVQVLAMKTVVTFFFGASGVLIYWYAARGVQSEVQVDVTRREVRLQDRNTRGESRLKARIAMSQIQDAFIDRNPSGLGASLYLRLNNRADLFHVATAPLAEIEPLAGRLSADLRPAAEKLELRMARLAARA